MLGLVSASLDYLVVNLLLLLKLRSGCGIDLARSVRIGLALDALDI